MQREKFCFQEECTLRPFCKLPDSHIYTQIRGQVLPHIGPEHFHYIFISLGYSLLHLSLLHTRAKARPLQHCLGEANNRHRETHGTL